MDINNSNSRREEEEQQKQHSLRDRALQTHDKARKLRRLYRQLRKARAPIWAARGVATAAASLTSEVWVVVLIILLVVGAFLFLLFFIIFIASGGMELNGGTDGPGVVEVVPVPGLNITLSEVEPVSAGSQVTVPINITYSGVEDVEVIASIPQGARFVSATGNYRLLGDLVSWRLSTNESTSPSDGAPPPLSNEMRTIYDLGFGPSDGVRINNFIDDIRPNSPMANRGDYIVELAREYNIDPLLIVVTINESQMCTDNGVVSPGGSDPDNFNCGGITWDTVTRTPGVDVQRWNARPGPEVNDHVFTFVPTIEDGLGLFFNYLGVSSRYEDVSFEGFYRIYNPCDDPGNRGRFACGAEHAREMIDLLEQHVGSVTERKYEFSLTMEAEGDSLEVRGYEVLGRYVDGGAVNF